MQRREEVALLGELDEVEPLRPRRRLDPECGVGAAAGDALRDGAVRRLDAVVAVDVSWQRARRGEQLVEDDSRPRAAAAVDEAQRRARQVAQGANPEWIAGGDDEPLAARRKTDQLVPAGLEHRPIDERSRRAHGRLGQRVKSGEQATTVVQSREGVDAAGEVNVEMELAMPCGPVDEQRQGFVVARRHRDHLGFLVEGGSEGPFELVAQRRQLRRKPRLRLPLRPRSLLPNGESRAGWPRVQTSRG